MLGESSGRAGAVAEGARKMAAVIQNVVKK